MPGKHRAKGIRNPDYFDTYVFSNDFPALTSDRRGLGAQDEIFRAMPAAGEALVVCFPPDHSRTLPELDQH